MYKKFYDKINYWPLWVNIDKRNKNSIVMSLVEILIQEIINILSKIYIVVNERSVVRLNVKMVVS